MAVNLAFVGAYAVELKELGDGHGILYLRAVGTDDSPGYDIATLAFNTKGEGRAAVLMRDCSGMPQLADYRDVPRRIWAMLTDQEKQHIEKRGGFCASSP